MLTGLKKSGVLELMITPLLLDGEASSADEAAIADALPLLREHCSNYSLERIYNIDETELFYRLEPDWTLTTKHFLDVR
uniref:Uncharacterized protein n=1 Tax=Rhizophagus irregularis (strain DAOM 181602 / DAOM 197198 / MUCL 43194) TaxID=747089 RepID=U9T8F3_RHIID